MQHQGSTVLSRFNRQNAVNDDPCDLKNRFIIEPFDTRTREFYIGGNEMVNAFPQINSMTHHDIAKTYLESHFVPSNSQMVPK